MSTPSIEALRQAFLDHESRVRRSDEWPSRPELAHTHPHIESIRVGGAKFLADQEIYLSQNLTTLIGGRGTGKSTLVEYLRIALQQEAALGTDKNSQLLSDFNNVRDTLGLPDSRIEVTYNKGADFKHQKLNLVVVNGAAEPIDASYGDINTYLPTKIYSRGQIEAIANDPQKQASIIDDLILAPLEALKNDERDIIRRLRDLNESLRQEPEIATARAKLIADISNLNAQIEAIKGRSSGLEKWSKWNGEKQYLLGLESTAAEHIGRFTATTAASTFNYKDATTSGDNPDFLKSYRSDVTAIIAALQAEISEAVEKAKKRLISLTATEARTAWQAGFDKIDAENKATIKELAEMGISFEAYDELFRRRETAQAQLDVQEKRLAEIVSNRDEFGTTYNAELLAVWKRQYELRSSMATQLNEQVTKTKVGTPTVQSEITKHGDFKSFAELMASHHKDKRVVSQTDWEAMLRAAFDLAQKEDRSPLDVIERWIKSANGTPPDFPVEDVQPKKLASLTEWLTEYDINELRTHRVADAVTVSLHRREDGKRVGDLVGRKLSAGQKATTVLSLLLAEGTCPIIIDQPEDDLDNEFVFEQLVPMLRSSKERRQIVVVTHNANVPVNGDAELIVPLEVRDSRGAQKLIENELTVGSLDRHPVQRAVELILEGSSEAFRRRREKYGV